jgi:hypothetical protein
MQVALDKPVPKLSRRKMAKRVEIVMCNHLGHPRRSRCKVRNHYVFAVRQSIGHEGFRRRFYNVVVVDITVSFAEQKALDFQLVARFFLRFVNFVAHFAAVHRDYHLYIGGIYTVYQILNGKHMRSGD